MGGITVTARKYKIAMLQKCCTGIVQNWPRQGRKVFLCKTTVRLEAINEGADQP
jgi:hypothetical protein